MSIMDWLYEHRPRWMRRIPPGAKVVRRLTWRHRLARLTPFWIRRWFFE